MAADVETMFAAVVLKPEKADGAAVELLVKPPNIEGVLPADSVDADDVVVRAEGAAKAGAAGAAVASPKIGLKFWMGALLSEDDVAGVVVVVAAAKMGLKPETSRGLLLLLLGAGVADTGVEVDGAEGELIWLDKPNRAGPTTGAAGLLLLGALEI